MEDSGIFNGFRGKIRDFTGLSGEVNGKNLWSFHHNPGGIKLRKLRAQPLRINAL